MLFKLSVCSISTGMLFHVIWNRVPSYLEWCSMLSGIVFQMKFCSTRTFIM